MDDAHDAEPEASPYVRLPWKPLAAAVLGVLLLALAAGLFANRYLRPQVTVVPTPVRPIAAALPPTSVPTPTVAATPTLAVIPTVVLVPTFAPTQTPQAQLPHSTALGPTLAASTSAAIPASPPSASPTVDPTSVAEVGQAYDNYWQVRAQALLELDKTHIDEVMAGDHLDSVVRLIDQLNSENRAIKTSIDHDYKVVQVGPDTAQIFDDYISDSVYVDPITREPLSEPASDELRVVYRLNRLDGKWKVVDSVHAD